MKITSFQIRSIRGIRSFEAEPKGNSIVISGPNGTGKSGIVDAIDFLFSGSIQRLSGTGTGNLSLDVHGKHIDDKVADSHVSAVMQASNGKSVTIRRALSDRKLELIKGDAAAFQSIEEGFASGQFQLTRRELLQFIVAEGSTRAEEIQELLDVSELNKLRRDLNAVVNKLDKQKDAAKLSRDSALKDVDLLLSNKDKDQNKRRARVNELRAILKKDPIATWTQDTSIASGLEQPDSKDASAIKRKEFQQAIDALELSQFAMPTTAGGTSVLAAMNSVVEELAAIEHITAKLKRYELLRLGLAQVPDDGSCPLCDTKWDKHDLIAHIKQKIAVAEKLKELSTQFDLLASSLSQQIDLYTTKLRVLKEHAKKLGNTELEAAVVSCADDLNSRRAVMNNIEALPAIRDLLKIDKGHIATTSLEALKTLGGTIGADLPEESPKK